MTMNDGKSAATKGDAMRRSAEDHYIWSLTPKAQFEDALFFERGEGTQLIDVDGTHYQDLISAFTRAATLGYGDTAIADAVREQLATIHYAGVTAFQADTTICLAEKMAELAPGDLRATAFVSSGSEANEVAIKLAKLYQRASGKPRAYKVISRWNAYHGAVGAATAASDWLGVRQPLEPGVPGVSHIPAPASYRSVLDSGTQDGAQFYANFLEQQILHEGPDLVAAFIAEPIMQANGPQIPPDRYLSLCLDICRKYEVLFIADEVITGFGRTGEWFAVNHWNIEPDIMVTAKAITAGYMPLGAATVRGEIWDSLSAFPDVHTYNGHPAASAAALAVIETYESEGLISRAQSLGATMLDRLSECQGEAIVGDVRGMGMWCAIDFSDPRQPLATIPPEAVRDIVMRARELGILVGGPNGTAIEVAPALNIEEDDLYDGIARLHEAIAEVSERWEAGKYAETA